MLPEGIGRPQRLIYFAPDDTALPPYLYTETFNYQHIMNYFYKALILAIDIMMAVTLGLEIRDRISARKKNKDNEVADPEPVTTD